MKPARVFYVACGLSVLAGCAGPTRTMDELSYTEQKAVAGQILKRCKDQKVPQAEMNACIDTEARREAAIRYREAKRDDAIAASGSRGPTTCQTFGNSVTCF